MLHWRQYIRQCTHTHTGQQLCTAKHSNVEIQHSILFQLDTRTANPRVEAGDRAVIRYGKGFDWQQNFYIFDVHGINLRCYCHFFLAVTPKMWAISNTQYLNNLVNLGLINGLLQVHFYLCCLYLYEPLELACAIQHACSRLWFPLICPQRDKAHSIPFIGKMSCCIQSAFFFAFLFFSGCQLCGIVPSQSTLFRAALPQSIAQMSSLVLLSRSHRPAHCYFPPIFLHHPRKRAKKHT